MGHDNMGRRKSDVARRDRNRDRNKFLYNDFVSIASDGSTKSTYPAKLPGVSNDRAISA